MQTHGVRFSQFTRRWPLVLLPVLALVVSVAPSHGEGSGAWLPVQLTIPKPLARTGHTLANFDGAGMLYGGQAAGVSGGDPIALTDLWQYTAAKGTFVRMNSTTPSPPARYGHAAAVDGISMFVFFGVGADGGLLRDVWGYNRPRTCWQLIPPAGANRPSARMRHSAVTASGGTIGIYVLGGLGGDGTTLLSDLWKFDTISGNWVQKADFPGGGRYGHAAVNLGGRMYVLGGTSASGPQNDVWSYTFSNSTWTQLTSDGDVPSAFTGSAAASGDFDGTGTPEIMLVGGKDASNADLGATYAITIDPVQQQAHWAAKAPHSSVFRAAGTSIARPAGQGSGVDLLLFGGEAADQPQGDATRYSTYVAPPPGADLTAKWTKLTQKSQGTGANVRWTLTGTVQVLNQGTVKTRATTLRLLLSADQTAHADDLLVKKLAVGALAPHKSQTLKWSAKLPAGRAVAGQYVVAVADALGQVTESDETNNAAASPVLH